MKRLLLLLFLNPIFVLAQVNLSVAPNPSSTTVDINESDVVGSTMLTNTSETDTVWLYWERTLVSIQEDWTASVCDNNKCYGPFTAECPENLPMRLLPGETTPVNIHINPAGVHGSAKVDLRIYDRDRPSNEVIATYIFDTTTSLYDEKSRAAVKLFPNPSEGNFSISSDADVKKVIIYNRLSKKKGEYNHRPGKSYDISDYPRGMYIVRMLDANNNDIRTMRLIRK